MDILNPKNDVKIIAETKDYIVVHKPPGLAVQSRRLTEKTLETMLRSGNRELKFLSAVNRLDQPVEGIVLLAKNAKAASYLTAQINSHNVIKEYLAVVDKEPESRSGRLVDFLLKDGRSNLTGVVKEGTAGAKRAELEYTCEKVSDRGCLLRIRLYTGRHHQIRAQLSNAGFPIKGDRKYNPKSTEWAYPALCSCAIGFKEHGTGRRVYYETTPTGEAFAGLLTYGETDK